MTSVHVAVLPERVSEQQIESDTLIVVDVLRASTTIISALRVGAECVIPVRSVDEARASAARVPGLLLCGERGGVAPEGFALGNSPLEYSADTVAGRGLVLTTTNGTRALSMIGMGNRVLIGAITNRASVCRAALGRDVTIVCAGTDGERSADDEIAAGLMVQWLIESGQDATETASEIEQTARSLITEAGSIEGALRATDHGMRLIGLGMGADILYAAGLDSSSVVPHYDAPSNEIRSV